MSESRIKNLRLLFDKIVVLPPETILGHRSASRKRARGEGEMELLDCTDYRTLVQAGRRALRWIDGIDCAISVMLASVTSTKSVGDQLWVKIIGPAATGKSTLCEAVSTNREYVLAKSTIRGFHSGFKTSGDGGDEDNSLIVQVSGKTLVTKDGDTLLQSPNLGQILSEGRDLYDSTSRSHYRNKMGKDYQGIRMTWILCGTSSLHAIDSSELGERFLSCYIMDGIDDDLEDEILWRVVNRAERNLSIEADGKLETHQEPAMTVFMQLTGGYVEYLRKNATELLTAVETSEAAMRKITRLGKFVSYIRARPSTRQEETSERELASRLVSQLMRLAKCLAVVLNRKTVDEEVMRRVRKVALDTARGQTLEIVRFLYDRGQAGAQHGQIEGATGRAGDKMRTMLRFLRKIGAVETFSTKKPNGVMSQTKYRLTDQMRRLYSDVVPSEVSLTGATDE